MAKSKLILDIRYFESDVPNVDGTRPRQLGRLFDLPVGQIGDRVARKLREFEFTTGGAFDHLYINFSTAVPESRIAYAERSMRASPRIRYLDFGADPKAVNRLSQRKKEAWVIAATFDAVTYVAGKDAKQLERIQRIRDLMEEYGDDMPIVHKTKETKTYSVEIYYRIATFGKKDGQGKKIPSTVWVEYNDRRSGECRRGWVANLKFYEDIFFLASSIAVKSGQIILKPRTSFKARLYNKRYSVPLTIDIDDLEIA